MTRSQETMILVNSPTGFDVAVRLGRATEDEIEGCLARVTIEGPTLATPRELADLLDLFARRLRAGPLLEGARPLGRSGPRERASGRSSGPPIHKRRGAP